MYRQILFTLSILLSVAASAQEYVTGLGTNPVIRDRLAGTGNIPFRAPADDTLPVSLPFFDDFSAVAVYPSADRWSDRFAFENADYAIFPVNFGTMTLDAISDSGNMYPYAEPGPEAFIADHLTSRYIRLDSVFAPGWRALRTSDSVYFSFYYQPQGRGLAPQNPDSLVLEFLVEPAHDSITPTDTIPVPDRWRHIWATRGMPLDTFMLNYNTFFRQVMIPVTDSGSFFKKTFRFRFYNYVSLASIGQPSWQSNCDHWNIDNVYLNLGRSRNDTIRKEIRFLENPPGMLREYRSMPYPQYTDDPTNAMADSVYVIISNRDTVDHNSTYGYTVNAEGGTFSKSYDGGEYVIRPVYKYGYVTYEPFAHPPVTFLYPISPADSALFRITHRIRDLAPGSHLGDTITGFQTFFNYFAYDDGTPELGYGLKGINGQLAYQFRLSKSPDTLRAVRFYFNKTLENVNQQLFFLTVWNDNNGKPGDTVCSRPVNVTFTDSLNKLATYHLVPPVRISGTFYVGTIQTTEDNLNIGFDRNNNAQSKIFYNVTGQWYNSAYIGAPVIRPVVGKPIPLAAPSAVKKIMKWSAYPNPCSSGNLNIAFGAGNDFPEDGWFEFRDLSGRILLSGPAAPSLDMSGISPGMYLLVFRHKADPSYEIIKIIISR